VTGAPTPVRGLFETHLTVRDVPRSVAFYRDVVGLPVALELPERNAAFLWIGGRGRSMLGLWGIGSAVNSMTLHIAFDIALDDVLAARAALLRVVGVAELPDDEGGSDELPARAVALIDRVRNEVSELLRLVEE